MPTLSITKSYADSTILSESDLDNIKTSIETFMNTTKLDASNIQDGAITADLIAAAVAGNGLAGGAGTALSVNVDGSTIEINSDTLRVKDGGITQVKQGAMAYDVSASTTSTITSTSYVNVTNLSVEITTTGRPVLLMLTGGSNSAIGAQDSATEPEVTIAFRRSNDNFVGDDNLVSEMVYEGKAGSSSGMAIPASAFNRIDFSVVGSADTYQYKVQAKVASGGNTDFADVSFVAIQL